MTHEENFDIMQILTEKDKPFLVRPRMLEYMKTVTVEEPPTVDDFMTEQEVKEFDQPLELPKIEVVEEPDPWVKTQEQYLSGHSKPDYPDYPGEPAF